MLAPWKENYDKPRQYIKKQRHHFANKGLYSQCYGFSSSYIWMWELDYKEGWVPKRIDAFKPLYWRRLLRVPWTARRSNQSILKELNPGYLLEGLKLNLQYFGHLMWRANSLDEPLMLVQTLDFPWLHFVQRNSLSFCICNFIKVPLGE